MTGQIRGYLTLETIHNIPLGMCCIFTFRIFMQQWKVIKQAQM